MVIFPLFLKKLFWENKHKFKIYLTNLRTLIQISTTMGWISLLYFYPESTKNQSYSQKMGKNFFNKWKSTKKNRSDGWETTIFI